MGMTGARYAIGVDFGTESGRAVLVELATGRELGSEVYPYANGVIDEHLPAPHEDVRLEHDWALQDPEDYLRTFQVAVPGLLRRTGVDPADVVGVGIDFTACTMLPTTADGTPLCLVPELRREPHSWVKLWKHHAAQPEADEINTLARERGEPWLPRYGGKISSEWFFSKGLQILREAPHVYRAADRLIEAADWVVWQLTGVETRNSCTAGYKAIWSKQDGFPSPDVPGGARSRLPRHRGYPDVAHDPADRVASGRADRPGRGVDRAAARDRRRRGQRGRPRVGARGDRDPPRAGWSRSWAPAPATSCWATASSAVEGMCGVVEDGIIPGWFGYEAGQSGVGDIFAWFVEQALPGAWTSAAEREGISVHALLEREAERLRPGESGLVALDWWNGNRSILVDADLSGLLVGATLATRPPEIYRALIEATAFGTRMIIEAFEASGVPVEEIVACGGLPEKNRMMMQHLRGRDRADDPHRGVAADTGPGFRDVRGGGRRTGGRGLRDHRGCRGADGAPQGRGVRPRPGRGARLRRAVRGVQGAPRLVRAGTHGHHEAPPGDPGPRASAGRAMRVLRLHGAGDLRLHEEPDPVAGPGEALIRITAVGLCGSDLHWYADGGIGDARLTRPLVLGHEMGGIVAAGAMAGMRVALDPAITCERCASCVAGSGNLCTALRFAGHGSTDGALRELMPWPARLLVRVPDTIPDAEVPMLESLGVALHAIELAHTRPGMRAGVYGCGPIGLLLIAALRARGVTVALASDPLAHRRAAALEAGAAQAVDVDPRGVAAGDPGEPLDIAFDAAGDDGALETAIATVRPGGRVVLVGIPGDDRVSFGAGGARRKGLTLVMSRRMQAHHLVRAMSLVAAGHVRLGPLVTARYSLAHGTDAFRALVGREGLKIVVQPTG